MCGAVGVGVGQDADLAEAQPREVVAGRVDPDGHGDVVHFLGAQDLRGVDLPGVQDLAAQRHDGLELAVAGLLGGAAGGVALDQEELGALRVLAVQSASLPGSAGPW